MNDLLIIGIIGFVAWQYLGLGGTGASPILPGTAARISLGGTVYGLGGERLRGVRVSIELADGTERAATTSSFGVYEFADLPPGEAATITASSRRYRFAPIQITPAASAWNLDLTAQE